MTNEMNRQPRKEIPHKEPIADISHPIWKEIERDKKRMGNGKSVEFILKLNKK